MAALSQVGVLASSRRWDVLGIAAERVLWTVDDGGMTFYWAAKGTEG